MRVTDIPDTPSQRYGNNLHQPIDGTITIPCAAAVFARAINVREHLYHPSHSETTLPAPAVPDIAPFVRSKF